MTEVRREASNMAVDALRIEALCKTYSNGYEALKGIDLRVEPGDFFALLGPNGAGKSTAIGIVASLLRKTSGVVRVMGHDLDREPAAARLQLGLVPQEFNFNIWEPIDEIVINQGGYYGIPRPEARRRAKEYLGELGLWDKAGQQASNLSGGMKRRLMIARALVHRPRLLILDEPTAGVDIEVRQSMWEFLRQLNAQGVTIILTTHYLEEAESLCRNIAIIHQGRMIENTSMRALLDGLHQETLVLYLRAPLARVPLFPGWGVRRVDEQTLEVDVYKGQGLGELFAHLSGQGVEVVSLRNKRNRLEELFLGLVQRSDAGEEA